MYKKMILGFFGDFTQTIPIQGMVFGLLRIGKFFDKIRLFFLFRKRYLPWPLEIQVSQESQCSDVDFVF